MGWIDVCSALSPSSSSLHPSRTFESTTRVAFLCHSLVYGNPLYPEVRYISTGLAGSSSRFFFHTLKHFSSRPIKRPLRHLICLTPLCPPTIAIHRSSTLDKRSTRTLTHTTRHRLVAPSPLSSLHLHPTHREAFLHTLAPPTLPHSCIET